MIGRQWPGARLGRGEGMRGEAVGLRLLVLKSPPSQHCSLAPWQWLLQPRTHLPASHLLGQKLLTLALDLLLLLLLLLFLLLASFAEVREPWGAPRSTSGQVVGWSVSLGGRGAGVRVGGGAGVGVGVQVWVRLVMVSAVWKWSVEFTPSVHGLRSAGGGPEALRRGLLGLPFLIPCWGPLVLGVIFQPGLSESLQILGWDLW